jgi:hypothetical protein
MYYFAFTISKAQEGSAEGSVGAAGCWINLPVYDRSLAAAQKMISQHGWRIDGSLVERIVSASDYSPGDEMLRYYQQALIVGQVLVFFVVKPFGGGSVA